MAKSNGFFGMRRGSTKSLTFSVLNGKQITKDRVTQVANPKSQKQQYQRAIMATVMAAYSEMKDICDHSFQGKRKGSENQREFMSRNLVAMRNAFLKYQEDSTTHANQKFFAVGPKTPTTLPCEWIISSGTLEKSPFLTYSDGNHTLTIPSISFSTAVGNKRTTTLGRALEDLGLKPGMQITFVCISAAAGLRIYQVYDEDYAGYADWEFHFCRFVVKSDLDLSKEISSTDETNYENDFLAQIWNEIEDPRTSPSLRASAIDFGDRYSTDHFEFDAEELLIDAQFDESLTGAIGSITSMVDEDLRSNSKLVVRGVGNLKEILGLSWDYVWDAWRKASQSLGESDMYLEGGSV